MTRTTPRRFTAAAALAAAALAAALAACRAPDADAELARPGAHGPVAGTAGGSADDTVGDASGESAADTVVWGSDRAALDVDSLAALRAREPDRLFLEGLLDRYEALDVLEDRAWQGGDQSTAGALAWRRDRRADAARDRVELLLRTTFRERYEPPVPEAARALADTLRRLPRARFQPALYDALVAEHAATLRAIDRAAPHLRNPEVRAALPRLRAFHRAAIRILEDDRPAR